MKVGIMQPYFFPYIGYWQLINAVDKFVVYDNIQYSKNGWIQRNRILVNGKDKLISLTLKKDSDYLDIRERQLADSFSTERIKIINVIKETYKKAPMFEIVYPILEKCIKNENKNLFEFIYETIIEVKKYLEINTEIIISSTIDMNHNLKNKYRVMETCKVIGADQYINPIGGIELYDKKEFNNERIRLNFIKTEEFTYKQFKNDFIPNLSIIDVMMFNSKEQIKKLLENYQLI